MDNIKNHVKLKPCPFCGSDDITLHGLRKFWVMCEACGAEGPFCGNDWATEEEAIDKWNKRYCDCEVR